MNIRLYTLLLPLLAALLPSCGTAFFRAPYKVGVQKPFVETCNPDGSKTGRLSNPREERFSTQGQELYRIGADYYVRCEVVYAPVQADFPYYTWFFSGSHFWSHNWYEEPSHTAEKGGKAVYYCRVPEDMQKRRPLAAYCKPLPQTDGHCPDLLSEQEAQQLHPALVKRIGVKEFFTSNVVAGIPKRISWTHYAMLPVTGLTAVVVDLPCSIVSSAFLGAAHVISKPFIH